MLEFLLSYRDATDGSLKRKAYEVVNSYQNQVDLAIQELENRKQLTGNWLKKLVASQNQEELNIIYEEIKKSPEFSQTDSQKIIDNHQKRTQTAINLETEATATEVSKQLAVKLRTVINGDTDKNTLESLQRELQEYQNSSEQGKKTVYNQQKQIIEDTLAEVNNELSRREQSNQEQNKTPAPVDNQSKNLVNTNKGSSNPAAIVIGGGFVIILITFLVYQVFNYRKKTAEKGLKLKKKKKNSKIII